MISPQSTARPIWRERNFLLFWLARNVSLAGSVITGVVLPILIFQQTGSALQTSLLATFNVLPYLVFGLFAGAVAEKGRSQTFDGAV